MSLDFNATVLLKPGLHLQGKINIVPKHQVIEVYRSSEDKVSCIVNLNIGCGGVVTFIL